ncbi:LmeA family phospholipid-binding protein [Streptomyces sp. SID8379]|uniref:LmeA family phospholipid-binding protein n=1 Tax=unclassified Streptomyces TaxID=2593676 RepID=UPI000370FFBC|nr:MULTISPECIES: DUF2993 domain-containing protein [unclassified Streptomyces]MYW62543.1 LmeA family phospholipid-binding protein [Streptomyces sp. SID8379]
MRIFRRLLIAAVILAAVLTGADRLAVRIAEGRAEDQLRASAGFGESTSVSITGFPFLTQIAANDLDELDAHVDHYESALPGGGTGRVEDLELRLHGVQFSNSYRTAVARDATGTALVPYAELLHAAPNSDQVKVTSLSDGGKNRVKIALQTADGGRHTLYGSVSVEGDTLRLHAQGEPQISGVSADQIRSATNIQQTLTRLPGGISLKDAEPLASGLQLTVGGSHVSLTG